jgi:hypothetical protein
LATLDEIRAEIKSIAGAVSDIGNVHDQMPNITMWNSVFEDLVSDGVLKVLIFSKNTRTPVAVSEGFSSFNKEHKWLFKYIYSSSIENRSDVTFDNLCEAICNAFDNSNKLNRKVKKLMPMSQLNKGYVMTCNILCHYAEFELTTTINL